MQFPALEQKLQTDYILLNSVIIIIRVTSADYVLWSSNMISVPSVMLVTETEEI